MSGDDSFEDFVLQDNVRELDNVGGSGVVLFVGQPVRVAEVGVLQVQLALYVVHFGNEVDRRVCDATKDKQYSVFLFWCSIHSKILEGQCPKFSRCRKTPTFSLRAKAASFPLGSIRP